MIILSAVIVVVSQKISDRENDENDLSAAAGDKLSAGEGEHGCSLNI